MSILRHTLVILCASAVLAGCGLKGPLKAPKKKPTTTSTTTTPPQPGTPSPSPQS